MHNCVKLSTNIHYRQAHGPYVTPMGRRCYCLCGHMGWAEVLRCCCLFMCLNCCASMLQCRVAPKSTERYKSGRGFIFMHVLCAPTWPKFWVATVNGKAWIPIIGKSPVRETLSSSYGSQVPHLEKQKVMVLF